MNLGTILPKGGIQAAGNAQVVQFQLDHFHIAREIFVHVRGSHVQTHGSGVARVPVLRFNYHRSPPEKEPEYGVYAGLSSKKRHEQE